MRGKKKKKSAWKKDGGINEVYETNSIMEKANTNVLLIFFHTSSREHEIKLAVAHLKTSKRRCFFSKLHDYKEQPLDTGCCVC